MPVPLNEAIFEKSESIDGQGFSLTIKGDIPNELGGNYTLRYREIHLSNSSDY